MDTEICFFLFYFSLFYLVISEYLNKMSNFHEEENFEDIINFFSHVYAIPKYFYSRMYSAMKHNYNKFHDDGIKL